MKLQNLYSCLLVAVVSLAVARAQAQKFETPPSSTGAARYSPDSAEIIKLVQTKTSDAVIISYIKANPRPYRLSPQEISLLKKKGASTPVLDAIAEHDRLIDANQYEWAAGTPEARQGSSSNQEVPPKASPADGLVKLPPPPAESAPPPKRLKRAWTSTVVVEQPPPGPKLELVPLSPGPENVWIPGRWAWREGQWVWQGGYWIKRPSPGLTWVNGYWAKHGRSWTWIEGRWR
jgi:hypothetical protein